MKAKTGQEQQQTNAMPKDGIIIEKILASMGISEYEPRVIELFLELIYRYVGDVFNDATTYMEHSGRPELDLEDIRLAIQSRVNYSFTEPPPVEFLLEVANKKNAENFGFIPEKPGVLLPPAHHCLTEINYQLQTQKQRDREEQQQQDQQQDENDYVNQESRKKRRLE